MKMIVGLGNPGQKYVGTRHNVGFEILGQFAKQQNASIPRSKFEAEYSEFNLGDEKVILLCPLTYMNLSGQSVSQAASFFRIDSKEILVVCDDFNLNINRVRFKPSGSAGGQNGLNDIIKRLGTSEFPRLRVGIGPVPPKWNPADFVLGKFTEEERAQMDKVIDHCLLGLKDWLTQGISRCMNRYNSLNRDKPQTSAKMNSAKLDSGGKKPMVQGGSEKVETVEPRTEQKNSRQAESPDENS